ncbi:MAG: DUF418 domain-containing protein [Sphingomonadaceae bacterium]|nr:DUF418 domain-containing protein [Sphingomonadaceae bacterium]
MTEQAAAPPVLAPVRGKDRIDVLDALRGFAILGIFYMNLPAMAGPVSAAMGNIRAMGWSPADQSAWLAMQTILEGTQRGMLEMLFGAGLMVTFAKAMTPDGPVAVADLYIRRNLWLLAFGLINIFLLLWPGDILHVYALCALALFPFRKLRVRWLLVIGLLFGTVQFAGSAFQYVSRTEMQATHATAVEKQTKGAKLTAEETKVVKEWQEKVDRINGKEPTMQKLDKDEARARSGSFGDYAGFWISTYILFVGKGSLLGGVIEAFGTMLIGIALWKLRFIQGGRTAREYLVVMVLAYGFGLIARYVGGLERMTFQPGPKTIWMTAEYARIAVSIGHVALINWLMQQGLGRKLLWPLLAAGQMAFTLYLMQQAIGLHFLYSPLGLHLPTAPGWAYLFWLASAVILFQLVLANLWMRWFQSGPLEWVWRSLAYCRKQPFRRLPTAG